MDKGIKWNESMNSKLEESKVGIFCLDKNNLDSRWMLFEAGAIAKTKDSIVCTFLMDVKSTDIEPPLDQFQHTSFSKDEIWKLVKSINRKVKENNEKWLPENRLESLFEKLFPALNSALLKVAKEQPSHQGESIRSDREILEEILQITRQLKHNAIIDNQGIEVPEEWLTSNEYNMGRILLANEMSKKGLL